MHEWFSRPLRFGDPQPAWKEIAAAANKKTPLGRWDGQVYDAVSGSSFKNTRTFNAVQDEDSEYVLFALRDGEPDYDHVLTYLPLRRRREIEDEIAYLEQQIEELNSELEER